ncbi:16S rRNA (guanine(966)-N(2))-methyltransferase RsmD [Paenilisteria rocourtiae]|uniref:16S rRNA (Guanine(966)-N(2))-methyltransferase RsmD n=1 Tax=Listeria rocourtiae TaxID=647910 RepID=A0A4R6ZS46_9LIST|nr:16S rRNA (guanine(966)-N(2))-methyltransferase RsmD [Listeria rocourtiae]MBC1434617.1 16S rRNA (guanine(966)-N(2))-methyltransferase RsmD [Listeria rocourtiae]MBC1603309.1 16S rRNA (guanine(966)-N(2))-methyltransferase RsmD [Listeria rocourtiae]TDR55405.1 16S rRNA (guanine(966)-N(2))-methyltransferase RsmD [Listeria rocourtiae]
MRVIAGGRKGHHLKAVPGTNTRPTTDKIKESLFSIIGPFFDGEKVLDLFAGSGGLGIEALSRGASECVFIDQAQAAIKTVHLNVAACHLEEQAHIFRNEAKRALKVLAKNEWVFDLVFLDPPYKKQQLEQLMMSLSEHELVADGALVICEHDTDAMLPDIVAAFKKTREERYGITVLSIFEYEKEVAKNE